MKWAAWPSIGPWPEICHESLLPVTTPSKLTRDLGTHPGQLGPVLRRADGVGDLVLLVELGGDVEQAGAALEHGRGGPVVFDVHDGGHAAVRVDGEVPLGLELGSDVYGDVVVWDASRGRGISRIAISFLAIGEVR